MEKKIFDIIPPKEIEREKPKETFPLEKPGQEITLSKIPFKRGFLIIALLIILGLAVLFNLSQAEIEISPVTEVLTLETKLNIETGKSFGLEQKIIPGTIFVAEKTISDEFPSSGKKTLEKKAEGVVRIYNNYSLPQTLVQNTRLLAPLEKFQPPLEEKENPWFRTLERVTIPVKSYKDVKVVADSPGEKYNIKPSKFSIPGLAGSPQYLLVYGESFQEFKGGFKKEVIIILGEDLEKAKNELSKRAKEETLAELKNKIPPEFVFLNDASKTEIFESFSQEKIGAELERFNYQTKAKSQALVFKKDDLGNFSRELILSLTPEEKSVYWESQKINYSLDSIDFSLEKMVLSLRVEIKFFSSFDETSLKEELLGRSLDEAKFFLENQPQFKQTKIKLTPFWLKKIPKDISKIEIKLRID